MTSENPTISLAEYRERWQKVQEMMSRHDLDFLIAYADDRAVFGPAHARWLANFPVHFEPVCILMPREAADCGRWRPGTLFSLFRRPQSGRDRVRAAHLWPKQFGYPKEKYDHIS